MLQICQSLTANQLITELIFHLGTMI